MDRATEGGQMSKDETSALNQEVRSIWNHNAPFWDEHTGEGNEFHRELVGPAAERLLALEPNELVLEIACGNGAFARQMARLGAQVVATDFSEVFVERARARSTEQVDRIEYHVIDATDEAQLISLGERRFDAAVTNMAIQDMAAVQPLASVLGRLLTPGGRFVFTLSHPCFNTTGCKMVVEQEDREGKVITVYSIKVSQYLGLQPHKGLGIVGQPEPHYYFDRPLHALFLPFFRAGFVIDGLEEPAFQREDEAQRPISWVNYREIPPVLAVRMRMEGA
jgi:2-polyprenyl-3-methyl-5-hydroxy-6-metoxy-1,4-benzoquinol methylase